MQSFFNLITVAKEYGSALKFSRGFGYLLPDSVQLFMFAELKFIKSTNSNYLWLCETEVFERLIFILTLSLILLVQFSSFFFLQLHG